MQLTRLPPQAKGGSTSEAKSGRVNEARKSKSAKPPCHSERSEESSSSDKRTRKSDMHIKEDSSFLRMTIYFMNRNAQSPLTYTTE